ncbi:hypothetical protein BJ742DRAFT_872899 [Cladochytrium replicatum]|nr:hypothetical protein BJ742DRAFT_872899 [Cladochytrium replicatum]
MVAALQVVHYRIAYFFYSCTTTAVVLMKRSEGTTGVSPTDDSPIAITTYSPRPTATNGYPIVLSSGSLLFDPIVHPTNNLQSAFNLSSIQPFASVVNNTNLRWRYHVAFGRTLSTSEAALSSPITKNRCNTNTAVCQEQIGGPDAYNIAVVGNLGYTALSNSGTSSPGLLIAFDRTPGDPGFCLWRVTLTIMCSPTTTSAPTFSIVQSASTAITSVMALSEHNAVLTGFRFGYKISA